MFGGWLGDRSDALEIRDFYFDRAAISRALTDALAANRHVLIYGLPRQGKTTLVRRIIGKRHAITLRASRDSTFADLTRNYLMGLGCSVTVEQTRKKHISGKAEVKFLTLFSQFISPTATIEAGADTEKTLRSFTADIDDPNDVCYLLREIGAPPFLVIDRFEQLPKKARATLIDFLQICSETSTQQVLLISSTLETPLDYREQIELSRYVSSIEVSLLSEEETADLVNAVFEQINCPRRPDVPEVVWDVFSGAMELSIDASRLMGTRLLEGSITGQTNGTDIKEVFADDLRSRAKGYLMALLTAVLERNWSVPHTKVVPVVSSNGRRSWPSQAAQRRALVLMHEGLQSDGVYLNLAGEVAEATAARRPGGHLANLDPWEAGVVGQVSKLARTILKHEPVSDSLRLLAFAALQYLRDPRADETNQYQPAEATISGQLGYGRLICDLLLEADLRQDIVITDQTLAAYFSARGLTIVDSHASSQGTVLERMAKRVRKLQRELRIDPPLIAVDKDRSRITIWSARNIRLFGDIKPDLEKLLDRIDEDADDDV